MSNKASGRFTPFDEDPMPLQPAGVGWVFCEACDAPQPVAGHECVKPATLGCGDPCPTSAPCFRCRAEFAESLLCALAWDHARAIGAHRYGLDSGCALCAVDSAARGGGR